jgi:nitroreductase
VVCSCVLSGDPLQDEEDLHATACAAYIVLLVAHARGLAGYWRTPEVLRTEAGRAAVGLPDSERFVSLIHLGEPVQERPAPARRQVAETVTYLD